MSKIFYDHLIDLSKVEKRVKKIAKTPEEREEIYQLIDEIIHHRMVGCILHELPPKDHQEFLCKFCNQPGSDGLMDYLKEHIKRDISKFLKKEIHNLAIELLEYVERRTRPEE